MSRAPTYVTAQMVTTETERTVMTSTSASKILAIGMQNAKTPTAPIFVTVTQVFMEMERHALILMSARRVNTIVIRTRGALIPEAHIVAAV